MKNKEKTIITLLPKPIWLGEARQFLDEQYLKIKMQFPTEERFKYKLISSKEIEVDLELFKDSKELKVLKNEAIGGVKLVYKVYNQHPRLIHNTNIPYWLPKNIYVETHVYWKPLKKYWNKSEELPYAIGGRPTSPFLGVFLRINKDFKDFTKEEFGAIKLIEFIKINSNKLMNQFLNRKLNTFYLPKI